jgi:hypothetical protein
MRLRLRFILFLFAISCASPLYAQGCAVCGNTAASSPAAQRSALNKGILVLLVPTLAIIGSFGVLLYKHRR